MAIEFLSDVQLPRDPDAPLKAATKQYVDAASSGGDGVADHGDLTGLTDDDHALYALADGSRGAFETAGAVAAHAAAPDPHTVYAKDTDLTAGLVGKENTGTAAAAITAHEAAADPHTGYQKETEKAAANGYASLDATTKVPVAQVPTGTSGTTVALGNHLHTGVYDPAGTAAARTPKITVASTAPGSPATNDVWIDTT